MRYPLHRRAVSWAYDATTVVASAEGCTTPSRPGATSTRAMITSGRQWREAARGFWGMVGLLIRPETVPPCRDRSGDRSGWAAGSGWVAGWGGGSGWPGEAPSAHRSGWRWRSALPWEREAVSPTPGRTSDRLQATWPSTAPNPRAGPRGRPDGRRG